MTAPHGIPAVSAGFDPDLGGSNRQERSDQAGTSHHHTGSDTGRFPMLSAFFAKFRPAPPEPTPIERLRDLLNNAPSQLTPEPECSRWLMRTAVELDIIAADAVGPSTLPQQRRLCRLAGVLHDLGLITASDAVVRVMNLVAVDQATKLRRTRDVLFDVVRGVR